jgi:hypothetical protein
MRRLRRRPPCHKLQGLSAYFHAVFVFAIAGAILFGDEPISQVQPVGIALLQAQRKLRQAGAGFPSLSRKCLAGPAPRGS